LIFIFILMHAKKYTDTKNRNRNKNYVKDWRSSLAKTKAARMHPVRQDR